MSKYILTFILKDNTEFKVETAEMSHLSLINEINDMIEIESDFFFERGSIKIEFNRKDIEKIKYKVLKDE